MGGWGMGMERRQTVRLQTGVSQNVFPNNRDRAIESGAIFQFPFRPSK